MKIRPLIFFAALLFLANCSGEVRDKMIIRHIDKLFQEGRYGEAQASVDSFISRNPNYEMAWTLKGHIEESLDNDSVAEIAYEKALAINPKLEQAITGMGIVSRKKGEFDKAAEYYKKAIDINPKYAQAYSSLVTIELNRQNYEAAVELGEKGYQLDKKDPIIAANLSIAYHYYGDTTNRDKYYQVARELNYKNLKILDLIFSGRATIFSK